MRVLLFFFLKKTKEQEFLSWGTTDTLGQIILRREGLCTAGRGAGSLGCAHWMPAALSPKRGQPKITPDTARPPPCREAPFWKHPLTPIIVFVSFLTFCKGGSDCRPNSQSTRAWVSAGTATCLGPRRITHSLEETGSGPRRAQRQCCQYHSKAPVCLRPLPLLQQKSPSIFMVSFWGHFLSKLERTSSPRPTPILIHLESYLNGLVGRFWHWTQVSSFISTRKRGTMFLSLRTGCIISEARYQMKKGRSLVQELLRISRQRQHRSLSRPTTLDLVALVGAVSVFVVWIATAPSFSPAWKCFLWIKDLRNEIPQAQSF